MPQLVIRSGSRAGQSIELLSGTIRLGRHPANDQCFGDATLPGHHCEIIVGNGIVQVRDLGSTNGTFIDGKSIKEAVLLPGQRLHLGAVELAFEDVPFQISIPALPVLPPPLCNRQSVGSIPTAVVLRRLAECNSAIRQTTSLRYGRRQLGKQIPARSGERIKVKDAFDCILTAEAGGGSCAISGLARTNRRGASRPAD